MRIKKNHLSYCVMMILIVVSCKYKEITKSEEFISETQVMDGIKTIPEWLQYEVANVLPLDSLNVWIPTGRIETSALIRVPRFPVQYSRARLDSTVYDLIRYNVNVLDTSTHLKISGVKNEQISAQIAVAAKQNISRLSFTASDFVSEKGERIKHENVKIRYVQYVPVQRARSELSWTAKPEEIYGPEVSGFGMPDVVADPLIELDQVNVPAYRSQPVWLTFFIPKNTQKGIYNGSIKIQSSEFQEKKIPISIEVVNGEIPDAKDYRFFLDLWLNPKAIALAHHLELWSDQHWELIGKYMEDLVSRGAKTITTTITHDPWEIAWKNGTRHSQTGIGYAPMIKWSLSSDSIWSYDYSIFDKYVELALKVGLTERIDVFSLTPYERGDKRVITYFDEKKGENIEKAFGKSDEAYETAWIAFLKDFEIHLKGKGWFEKTYLSFDESPKGVIESILKIVREGAPQLLNRFSIAGKPETSGMAKALSVFYPHFKPDSNKEMPMKKLLSKRRQSKKTTTWYLCGDPAHPNTFTYSPAIESQLIPWLTLRLNVDGYLRWAYNSWSDVNPIENPVFNYIQGDDYHIYPGVKGPRSSIRWELLKEGIEDYELFKMVEQFGNVSNDKLQRAIEMATRNEDGRYKDINDFLTARKIILSHD